MEQRFFHILIPMILKFKEQIEFHAVASGSSIPRIFL